MSGYTIHRFHNQNTEKSQEIELSQGKNSNDESFPTQVLWKKPPTEYR